MQPEITNPIKAELVRLLGLFTSKPMLAIFLAGMAAGFPLTLVFAISSAWLKDYGVAKSAIGFFALTGSFYSLKFLWSPLVDQINFGALGRRFGPRRSWMALMLVLIVVLILGLAQLDPSQQLWTVGLMVATVAFCSATLDIVVDALRIEWSPDTQQAQGSAMYVYGYRLANFASAYVALILSDYIGWAASLSLLALFALPGFVAILWMGEPKTDAERHTTEPVDESFKARISRTIIAPFQNFINRPHWISILGFIFLFKLGDAFLDLMTTPFFKEIGFSNTDIANATKIVGTSLLMIGVGLGGWIWSRFSPYLSLLITVILMLVTNLGFAWLALVDATLTNLTVVVGAEKFATGIGATVLIAYLSGLTNIAYTATQFALLSSFATLGRTLLGANGGWIAENIGWFNFFILATLLAVPGLLMLIRLKALGSVEAQTHQN